MPDSDPITTGLVVAGTMSLIQRGEDFITAVLGHPGESIGTVLGDLTKRRLDNLRIIGGNADLVLLNIGVKTDEIPLRILQPALEAASLEEEPFLQERWANLLANAADPRDLVTVEALFPSILKDLSSREVRFLDQLSKGVDMEYSQGDLLGFIFTPDLLHRNTVMAGFTWGALDCRRGLR